MLVASRFCNRLSLGRSSPNSHACHLISLPQAQILVESLSERELDILRLLSQGATNKEIASRLIITVGTVKNHVTNILAKLGVRDRTQAAIKAKELGII